jgi:Cd2+/Zn2+-exporting ATPase
MKAYKLQNLTCAHCAATIEDRLSKLESVLAVRLQFATLDLHVDTTDLDDVKRTIASIEPEVRLVEPEAPALEPLAARWPVLLGATLVLAALLVAQALGWEGGVWTQAALAGVYLVAGWAVLKAAFLNLLRGHVFDENFLMSLATLAAWVVGAGAESASVMVFYQWGEILQGRAVERSRRSLGALLAARPRAARVVDQEGLREMSPDVVVPGTVFEVRAGELVPLDGIIVEGTGLVDTASLTGETVPVSVAPGSEVSAGTVSLGILRLKSLRPFSESVWAGIVASVDEALARKAPLDRFITRFARTYTPTVLVLAIFLFGTLALVGLSWHDALYRSLVLLVISCPCALVVSIPLTYLAAIGAASRKKLLIRDAGALDRLARVNAAAFDKTGTLTEGKPRLKALVPAEGTSEDRLRSVLDVGFAASSHPLAKTWGSAQAAADAVESKGQGVTFSFGGGTAAMGRRSFLKAQGFPGVPSGEDAATTVHAAAGSGYLGRVDFEDPAKADTPAALQELRSLGVQPLALLSGDTPAVVSAWGQRWGVTAQGGLLPQDKLAFVDRWESEGRRTLYVGDGLNDAPVLARASVGASLGAGASAAAIETADVAVLDSSPLQAARLVRLGRRTRGILYQNIGLALGLKALFMVLGGLGLAGLWEAVFADVGVALLAVANSLRAARNLS